MEDTHLTFHLRETFCRVMRCVHLDIFPHGTVNPVEYARLWNKISDTTDISSYSPWRWWGVEQLWVMYFALACPFLCIYVLDNSTQKSLGVVKPQQCIHG